MKKENILKQENRSIAKVLIASMSENEIEYASRIGAYLRQEDINTDMFLEDKKLKAKFKYADKLHIPYVIVIGEEEVKNETVTLKDMESGNQETLKLDDVIKRIK